MNVLFIEAEETFYMDVRTKMLKRWVYLGEIATFIGKKVEKVKVMDCIDSRISHCEILKEVENTKYDLICCLTRIETLNSMIKLIPLLKTVSPKTKILIYGDMPCMFENFIKENINRIDAIVKSGDWDLSIANYIDYISKKTNKLFGIMVKENDEWKDYSKEKSIENFNHWCFTELDENIVNVDLYKSLRANQVVISVSRGCPYNCKFCSAVATFKNKDRRRDIHEIVEYMKKYKDKVSLFKLFSPTFTYDEKWVTDFCKLIIKENLKVNWEVTSRPDCLQNENLIKIMAEAGCLQISVGVETIDRISNMELNKFRDIELYESKLVNMFRIANKYNVKIYVLLMIGIKGQTKENIYNSIKFLKKNGSSRIKISAYSPRQELIKKDSENKLTIEDINKMDKRTYINYLPKGLNEKEFLDLIYNNELLKKI